MVTQKTAKRALRTDAAYVVHNCSVIQLRLAARLLSRHLDSKIRSSGLSVEQFALMCEIASTSDDSLSSLAWSTGLEKSTLSRNLRSLEVQGLVEISKRVTRSRKRHAWLTEKGARKLERALPAWRTTHQRISRLFDSGAVQAITASSKLLASKSYTKV